MILIIKHVKEEGPGLIGDYFSGKGYVVKTVDLSEGDSFPDSTKGIQAVISMGGPMNVYEETKYPFLIEEDLFIKKILKKNIPFLGICLGAQLLAKAAGAEIIKSSVKEIGFSDVFLSKEGKKDPIFNGIKETFNVFQWHEDMFLVPDNGTLLAENNNCANQAMKTGESAYGLQFHVEADKDMIQDWMKRHYDNNEKGYRSFEKDISKFLPEVLNTGLHICLNFEKYIVQK